MRCLSIRRQNPTYEKQWLPNRAFIDLRPRFRTGNFPRKLSCTYLRCPSLAFAVLDGGLGGAQSEGVLPVDARNARYPECTENNLSRLFTLLSIVCTGLAGTDHLSVAPTRNTNNYEYCLEDYSSGTRKCGFDTIEKCIAVIPGRGSCARSS